MTDYYVLSRPEGVLDIALCAHTVDSVTKLQLYKGTCLYFPSPDSSQSTVLLMIDPKDASASETDWFLRTLAGYLQAEVRYPSGESVFEGTADNDPDFLEQLPPPDEECPPVRLLFTLDGLTSDDYNEKIFTFFGQNQYELSAEADGYTIYLSANSYLDLFYTEGEGHITGEIDCSFSGAGVYAEAVELAEALADFLSCSISFVEDARITYSSDKNFDKLRRAFYLPIAQQLTFAVNDDRDGLPAYLGWGTDSFEPAHIRGSLVTPFGRYDIERLIREIETYGFSYVCDHRFLTRNTPTDGADFYIKEALNLIWSSTIGAKDDSFSLQEILALSECRSILETALEVDPYAPFPKELYRRLCSYSDAAEHDCSKCSHYLLHYEPGYMKNDIFCGFGHYLRRFRMPGTFSREDIRRGEEIFLYDAPKSSFRLAAEISYGYSGDGSESPLGHNWAVGGTDKIETFDIGGSSVVRYIDGDMTDGLYRAEAEVYIQDELVRFAMASSSHDDVLRFRESLKGCISVEDWYDEYIKESGPDPHAPGATFCANVAMPPCRAFELPFPQHPEYFYRKEIDPALISRAFESLGSGNADRIPTLDGFIGAIAEQLCFEEYAESDEDDDTEDTDGEE